MLSIIIPTLQRDILTLKSLKDCPVPYELILARERGLGYARNEGARESHGDQLLFLDDDLRLKPTFWNYVLSVKPKEINMTFNPIIYRRKKWVRQHPCTRAMSIRKEDFWNIGGFDEEIQYVAEDLDFFLRGRKAGYVFNKIPTETIEHQDHPVKRKSLHLERGRLLAKHGLDYIRFFGGLITFFVRRPIYRRHNFLLYVGFFYYLIRGVE